MRVPPPPVPHPHIRCLPRIFPLRPPAPPPAPRLSTAHGRHRPPTHQIGAAGPQSLRVRRRPAEVRGGGRVRRGAVPHLPGRAHPRHLVQPERVAQGPPRRGALDRLVRRPGRLGGHGRLPLRQGAGDVAAPPQIERGERRAAARDGPRGHGDPEELPAAAGAAGGGGVVGTGHRARVPVGRDLDCHGDRGGDDRAHGSVCEHLSDEPVFHAGGMARARLHSRGGQVVGPTAVLLSVVCRPGNYLVERQAQQAPRAHQRDGRGRRHCDGSLPLFLGTGSRK
mmetsp:Transcript_6817/g.14185  ORF Transcript_6817/g.14185 Transcript_6817/m.14185 type:complete len:281 (-) Transcript_6817:687-1529(-)